MPTETLPRTRPEPAPAGERAVLTATELRQVAEWAHSVRITPGDEGMCMVVYPRAPGHPLKFVPLPRPVADRMGPEFIVIPIDTENRVQKRLGIGDMRLTLKRRDKPNDLGKEVDFFAECRARHGCEPDAMFWTESSVEKFLVPYYASVHSSDHTLGTRMQRIADVFDGKVKPNGELPRAGEEVTVYAMVHLPKSEYVASPPDEPTLGVLCSVHPRGEGEVPTPTVEVLAFPA